LGVHGTNEGLPAVKFPRFTGWNPSTSFLGLIDLITASLSMWSGSGNWTRIP